MVAISNGLQQQRLNGDMIGARQHNRLMVTRLKLTETGGLSIEYQSTSHQTTHNLIEKLCSKMELWPEKWNASCSRLLP